MICQNVMSVTRLKGLEDMSECFVCYKTERFRGDVRVFGLSQDRRL